MYYRAIYLLMVYLLNLLAVQVTAKLNVFKQIIIRLKFLHYQNRKYFLTRNADF